uniref:Serpentine receptor class gamma n=2 Tax=Caenorhabditis tropicalis TaxID=1561998 RepID=A0A1I7TLU9_9PELO
MWDLPLSNSDFTTIYFAEVYFWIFNVYHTLDFRNRSKTQSATFTKKNCALFFYLAISSFESKMTLACLMATVSSTLFSITNTFLVELIRMMKQQESSSTVTRPETGWNTLKTSTFKSPSGFDSAIFIHGGP